jgi:hypothetical protein
VVSCHDDTTVSLAAHREVARRFARGRVLDVQAGHDPFVADPGARRLLWGEIDRAVARRRPDRRERSRERSRESNGECQGLPRPRRDRIRTGPGNKARPFLL